MSAPQLFHESHGWNPDWPSIGTTAVEERHSGHYSIWILIHSTREPRWFCVDSTGPGWIGKTVPLADGLGWRRTGRVPGTPVWPVAAAYPKGTP